MCRRWLLQRCFGGFCALVACRRLGEKRPLPESSESVAECGSCFSTSLTGVPRAAAVCTSSRSAPWVSPGSGYLSSLGWRYCGKHQTCSTPRSLLVFLRLTCACAGRLRASRGVSWGLAVWRERAVCRRRLSWKVRHGSDPIGPTGITFLVLYSHSETAETAGAAGIVFCRAWLRVFCSDMDLARAPRCCRYVCLP